MNVFLFLKGELRQSKGVFFGLTVLLALALAVAVSVIQTERMVKSSTIRAADQFDILVGTKGSRSALLLGTVYLRDEMLSLVPMPVLNNLSPKSSDISWAAPLAFGDRAGKASLVGTTRVFVDQAGKRTLLAGRNFEKPYEAVAGSNAGVSLNDEFRPGHGMSAALGHEHNESFKIVGILPETGTPWDRAVLVPIEALWTMHGQNPASRHAARGDHAHEEIEAWAKMKELNAWDRKGFSGDLSGDEGRMIAEWNEKIKADAKEKLLSQYMKDIEAEDAESLQAGLEAERIKVQEELCSENELYEYDLLYDENPDMRPAILDKLGFADEAEFKQALRNIGGTLEERTNAYMQDVSEAYVPLTPEEIRRDADERLASTDGQ